MKILFALYQTSFFNSEEEIISNFEIKLKKEQPTHLTDCKQ